MCTVVAIHLIQLEKNNEDTVEDLDIKRSVGSQECRKRKKSPAKMHDNEILSNIVPPISKDGTSSKCIDFVVIEILNLCPYTGVLLKYESKKNKFNEHGSTSENQKVPNTSAKESLIQDTHCNPHSFTTPDDQVFGVAKNVNKCKFLLSVSPMLAKENNPLMHNSQWIWKPRTE